MWRAVCLTWQHNVPNNTPTPAHMYYTEIPLIASIRLLRFTFPPLPPWNQSNVVPQQLDHKIRSSREAGSRGATGQHTNIIIYRRFVVRAQHAYSICVSVDSSPLTSYIYATCLPTYIIHTCFWATTSTVCIGFAHMLIAISCGHFSMPSPCNWEVHTNHSA